MAKVYVDKSTIHGSGLFVSKSVKRGGFVCFIKGKIKNKINKNKKDAMSNSCWVGISKNAWIDPKYPYLYINHSCNPTVGIRGKVTVVALDDMKPGDEIVIDYSTIEADRRWSMSCACGESKCRKVVKSIEFLPEKYFKNYLPFVSTYFRGLYIKKQNS